MNESLVADWHRRLWTSRAETPAVRSLFENRIVCQQSRGFGADLHEHVEWGCGKSIVMARCTVELPLLAFPFENPVETVVES